ncbi:MAG: glycine cleavage system aminomethyltransferase GcvT [Gammaproteobacteria bacterium]
MSPTASNPAEAATLQRTPLHALHISRKAKMVPFAGYEMPLQYANGIKHEHEHTRTNAGLFDVSHMGQIRIRGDGADSALEALLTGDIQGLREYSLRYTLFTNEQGGILDDLMVTRVPDGLFLVVNAACKENDFARLQQHLGPTCETEMLPDRALLALQGPAAATVLGQINPDVTGLSFMQAGEFELNGHACLVSRSGYTGEDGFEISVAADQAQALAEQLLEFPQMDPVGLGARDSLRLEAGLCLYGHDLDETMTPVEADLAWAIAKKYRRNDVAPRFPGAGIIMEQIKNGAGRKRVGLKAQGRTPIREGAPVLNNDDIVGRITSGGFGPSAGGPVAMGYVDNRFADIGTVLQAEVRNRRHEIHVAELPFIQTRYHKN